MDEIMSTINIATTDYVDESIKGIFLSFEDIDEVFNEVFPEDEI